MSTAPTSWATPTTCRSTAGEQPARGALHAHRHGHQRRAGCDEQQHRRHGGRSDHLGRRSGRPARDPNVVHARAARSAAARQRGGTAPAGRSPRWRGGTSTTRADRSRPSAAATPTRGGTAPRSRRHRSRGRQLRTVRGLGNTARATAAPCRAGKQLANGNYSFAGGSGRSVRGPPTSTPRATRAASSGPTLRSAQRFAPRAQPVPGARLGWCRVQRQAEQHASSSRSTATNDGSSNVDLYMQPAAQRQLRYLFVVDGTIQSNTNWTLYHPTRTARSRRA
jgi:hypothetical protein